MAIFVIVMEFKAESSVKNDFTLPIEHNSLLHHQEYGSEIELVSLGNRDEITQSWIRAPESEREINDVINLGCFNTKKKTLIRWTILAVFTLFIIFGIPSIIKLSKHGNPKAPQYLDEYSKAVKKALMFFNAQRFGGYYDGGDNIKFHFRMAFSVTMLSWSVIEYSHKYKSIGEYQHVRSIIRWGTDYLLMTFDSNASDINFIYNQVGIGRNASTVPDDHYCWTRPEDMDYPRPVIVSLSASDLGGEVAAALAAASIVFRDDIPYSIELIKGASIVYKFARRKRMTYSNNIIDDRHVYNSSGYWGEYIWSTAWMYYVTGDKSYMLFGTNVQLARNAEVYLRGLYVSVLSWDNKLPTAVLLWTRMRIIMNPGYPYEESLKMYHETTELNMCSYMRQYHVFNWTKGGLIQLNRGHLQKLQCVVNASFLANLYSDYMDAIGVPEFYCGKDYFNSMVLRNFASSQLKYIMGKNPRKMSYIVGYGRKYPQQVHHRGPSIPRDGIKYSCQGGVKWRDNTSPNLNIIAGSMFGGSDTNYGFLDVRVKQGYTEATIVGNAGLVAALASVTNVGGRDIDKNTIFGYILPMFLLTPPPPETWEP